MGKNKRNNNGNIKKLLFLLVLLIIIAVILFVIKNLKKDDINYTFVQDNEEEQVEEKQVQIVDVNSKTRPYAVMINNNHDAWPQCGLQDAYLVYEIISEGGITRMMALYKDKETAQIGSVRSSRHYYIDYAEENDAIYVHFGGSPQAYSRLTSIDNIDGMALEGICFWRDTTLNRSYEHTAFTSLTMLKEYAEKQGYTRDTNKDLLLNYSVEEIDLETMENVQTATNIDLKYSYYHTTSYEYDEENKVYKRSMSGTANVDLLTGEQYTVKNIIIYQVANYTLDDGSNKGRQELDNIGSGTGYYVTDGYAVPITWEKTSHSEQTVYRYENGEELVVNDGNTFIQIVPTTGNVSITSNETTTEAE